ncbi:MAG: Cys-tRNA(Pro) deacylase [Bifidobacteriaceae bacterium]|jgi:Cys-tRNA(Pro)/Cys-tRNA(Cys) deacylase|nr:Cys-tRNA(Pro) deacylase [Bifidobacteriaceae bacterium]MCI1914208.1 Cys-tRNA(Pro) deacylase [Bifidobacteriaceae bacterium]
MSKKKKSKETGSTPAIIQLEKAGATFDTVEYDHSADDMAEGYGIEGATKLGMDPHQVFKTLLADSGSELVVGIVPVSGHLDLKKLAAAANIKKLEMANPQKAQRATGYVVGGISPFGQKTTHRTFLDASALDYPTILVSGGKRGFDVVIDPNALLSVLGGISAAIAKR